jgi:pimeloyl-ACP methyl ester carboxylesterase
MLTRRLITLPTGQLQARTAGSGAPIALLHASPLNAGFMRPQIEALASAGFCAIGIDTPGYGGSDHLPRAETLRDYADAIGAAMSALGHERFGLYGTATGAQIALSLAKAAPDRVTRLVLDNCGHFDPALRATWEAGYFPDTAPAADGSHLVRIWDMCVKQATRFPWHLDGPANPAPPADMLQAMARAYLEAGPDYHRAYRLAFHAEDIDSFAGLTTPTVLLDWEGSVVRAQIQVLIGKGLPACVRVLHAGAGLDARLSAIAAAFA